LVEQISQGNFVPHGHQDILLEAIEQLEHPDRVHAIEKGVEIQQYFGATP